MIDIPGYRIEREFGEGGMAKVYLAIQESLDRPVAMKVLSTDLVSDDEFCKRFLREGKTLASLSHPNVVKIIDCGEHEGVYFMTMELMPGGTLSDRLESGDLTPEKSIDIIKKVASALAWSHGKGLIHRDVKPGNVLFSEHGSPVLGDFGIAKTTKQGATRMTALGMAIGTPTYMSPEQASAKEVTPKSDQYSLGVMFFEMLTGHAPYEAETAVLVAVQHIQAEVPELPSEFKHFQPIIDRMMAKDPEQRFDTLEELVTALDNVSPDRTEYFEAPKTPAPVSMSKPFRLVAGGTAAALLIIGAAYFYMDVPDAVDIATTPDPGDVEVTTTPGTEVVAATPPNPEVVKWLEMAQAHYDIGRLYEPPVNNSMEAYWKVLELDATNADAVAGLERIAAMLEPLARESLENDDIDESKLLVEKGLLANPNNKDLIALQKELDDL